MIPVIGKTKHFSLEEGRHHREIVLRTRDRVVDEKCGAGARAVRIRVYRCWPTITRIMFRGDGAVLTAKCLLTFLRLLYSCLLWFSMTGIIMRHRRLTRLVVRNRCMAVMLLLTCMLLLLVNLWVNVSVLAGLVLMKRNAALFPTLNERYGGLRRAC